MSAIISNHIFEIMLAITSTLAGWAWRVDRRVGRLEARDEAKMVQLDRLESKLDKLVDKLL